MPASTKTGLASDNGPSPAARITTSSLSAVSRLKRKAPR